MRACEVALAKLLDWPKEEVDAVNADTASLARHNSGIGLARAFSALPTVRLPGPRLQPYDEVFSMTPDTSSFESIRRVFEGR